MADSTATVETLLIRIGADVVDLKKGMQEGRKSVEDLEKATKRTAKEMETRLSSMASAVTTRVAALAAGFLSINAAWAAFQRSIQDISMIQRLSQSTGIAVDQLSELKFAAEQSGVEFEALRQVISQFGGRMAEAISNPASRGAQALQLLGVSITDTEGSLRNFAQVLPELADSFSRYADGANKSALASALFGEEAGPRLVPLLNQGSAGLAKLTEEAQRLGVVLDAEAIRKAEEFRKSSLALQGALDALIRELTILAAPTLTAAVKGLTDLIRALSQGIEALRNNARLNELSQAYEKLNEAAANVKRLHEANERLMEQLSRIASEGGPGAAEAFDSIRAAVAHNDEQLAAWIARAKEAQAEIARLKEAAAGNPLQVTVDEGNVQKPQAPSLGGLSDQMKEAQFQLQEFLTIAQGGGTIAETLALAWEDTSSRIAEAQRRATAAITDSAERQRQMTQIKRNLLKQEEQAYITVAQTAAQALTALFPKSKAAAIAAAIINTAVAITEALKLPFPLNLAQAALVAAMGAAQIATIRSTSQSGGGSAPSPGGGGGGGGGSSPPLQPEAPAPGRALFIQGVDPAAIFSGRQLEELIRNINLEVQNGATLISTRNITI
jgi:hypothetical protein